MWACAFAVSVLALHGVYAGAAGAADRVASAALCADDYVLALLGDEPDRITALSWQSGAAMSQAPAWARDKPRAWADAERLLALDPDLVVFGPGASPRAADWMERFDITSVSLAWTDDFDGVRSNLRTLGAALDRAAQAETVITDIDARLAALEARSANRAVAPRVLYLDASARTAGAGAYVDTAIIAAGARNLAADAGIVSWSRLPLETVLGAPPDLVVTSFFRDGFPSASFAALRHPLYRRVISGSPQVEVPGGDWICAGPRLIDAAEAIADGLDALTLEPGTFEPGALGPEAPS